MGKTPFSGSYGYTVPITELKPSSSLHARLLVASYGRNRAVEMASVYAATGGERRYWSDVLQAMILLTRERSA